MFDFQHGANAYPRRHRSSREIWEAPGDLRRTTKYMELNMFRRRRSACLIQRSYRQRPGLCAQPSLLEQGFVFRNVPSVLDRLIDANICSGLTSSATALRSAAASIIQREYRQRRGLPLPTQALAVRKGPSVPRQKPALRSDPTAAACVIQRFVRKQKCHRRWAKLIGLRKSFIDADVIQPGELYLDKNLLAREALRTDPVVARALDTAWNACTQGAATLSREAYFTMMRKLYLAVTLDEGLDPNSNECMSIMERDWARDAGYKGHLTRHDFEHAWFQLSDLYTNQVQLPR